MRTVLCIAISTASIFLGVVSSAIATQAERSTLERCTALLPKGEKFTFEMSGTVDTHGEVPKLNVEFSMSDGTERDRSKDGEAFGACFAKLIR